MKINWIGKVFGFIIFTVIASIIIFYLFYRYSGNSYIVNTEFVKQEHRIRILSMREIDSLTAALNYHFTVKNKVVPRTGQDSLKIPVKAEIPSG